VAHKTALPPRLLIAAPSSRSGKTTVAVSIMAGLTRRGLKIAPAKVGPDFIDPSYHEAATKRPRCNLDAFLANPDLLPGIAAKAAKGADLLVIEGAMGLFDGAVPTRKGSGPPLASSADVARLLKAPVVLVVDASSTGGSLAALVHGFASFDPHTKISGVILNKVGSDQHEALAREAVESVGIEVLGCLRRDDHLAVPQRELGLLPAEGFSRAQRWVEHLGELACSQLDLPGLVALASQAPRLTVDLPQPAPRQGSARIGYATGPAFSFCYRENLERLKEAGAELVPFDPTAHPTLPPGLDALYLGGGFPERYLDELGANETLAREVRAFANSHRPIWAECGGAMWLSGSLNGRPMCGVLPATSHMGKRLQVGYREATALGSTWLCAAGSRLVGHEHHWGTLDPPGDLLSLSGRSGTRKEGWAWGPSSRNVVATFLHAYLGGDPAPAVSFLKAAIARRGDINQAGLVSPALLAGDQGAVAAQGPTGGQLGR
jgi:cobyrinic acid a,c-diamide synthase